MTGTAHVFTLQLPQQPSVPLFFDSPHSGAHYPDDFRFVCPAHALHQSEDRYVDHFLAPFPALGMGTLAAHCARSYIDMNRARDDIDPLQVRGLLPFTPHPTERSYAGHGLIRHVCRGGPVYAAALPAEEVMRRITACYDVYHAALAKALQELRVQHGEVFLVDCHSMPSSAFAALQVRRRAPDIVLGDRGGAACDAGFIAEMSHAFRSRGYSVAHNDPYRGVEIVRRWGRPREGYHAVQLEISRSLYMNEDTLETAPGFARVKNDFEAVMWQMKDWLLRRRASEKQAAE